MPSLPLFGKKVPQTSDAPANNEGVSDEGKDAGKIVSKQPEVAGADVKGSDRKEAVRGNIISQRKKGRHGKYRGKRKN